MIEHIATIHFLKSLSDNDFGSFGLSDRIYVLDLDKGLHLLLEQFLEETLELVTSEVFENFFPIWRVVEITQVWLHVA